MSILERAARDFATERHAGQVRKYTDEPYTNHLAGVVELVRSVPHSEEMLAAAWLHDVLEDTPTQADEVFRIFGPKVAIYVNFLTDNFKQGNRATRKGHYRNLLASAPAAAKTIKLADLIDNTTSIVENDPKFAKVYMREKEELLTVLQDGDPTLWDRAHGMIQKYNQGLI